MTIVSIGGEKFLVDGKPTYAGRSYEGHLVEGLLFNIRAVQALFDDANPSTLFNWAYPDTGVWDPQRNTDDFCAALPAWKEHGVLGFTVGFQGGGPLYSPRVYEHYDNSAFTPQGDLKPDYAGRLAQVLAAADDLGMVVIASFFYWKQVQRMENAAAVHRALQQGMAFLRETGRRNVLVEIANEAGDWFGYDFLAPEGVGKVICELRAAYPEFLYGCSLGGMDVRTGGGMPPGSLIEASDYVLIHGNGNLPPGLEEAIHSVQNHPAFRARPKPLVINEDTTAVANLEPAWRNGVSWGYYDQGFGGEDGYGGDVYIDFRTKPRETCFEDLSGFQTPPVNWGINTAEKKAFFRRVAEITGASSPD